MNLRQNFAAVATIAFAALITPHSSMAQQELRIGTASLGGAFYPMGQALSTSVDQFADGYTMIPVVTGGGLENPRLVASGEVDIAIASASLAFLAVEGDAPYKEALDIRGIGALHTSVLHIVTLPDSGIESIADLKGRTVAVGPAGGGTIGMIRNLFTLYDMSMDDITPSFLSYADGMSQLADGNVDASFAVAGFPTGAVSQAIATNELAFLELDDEQMNELTTKFPYYTKSEIPADVYGNEEPITVIGSANLLVANASMTNDLAYTIAQSIYDHMDDLIAANALAAKIEPNSSLELPIPLHPGAQKYFEERK